MTLAGPIVAISGAIWLIFATKCITPTVVGRLLFSADFEIGFFNAPNAASNMLCVQPNQRGVASATGIMTLMFTSMVGIVLTFSFVLNELSRIRTLEKEDHVVSDGISNKCHTRGLRS